MPALPAFLYGEDAGVVLDLIASANGMSAHEISALLGITLAAVCRHIRALIADGAVTEISAEWTVTGRGSPRRSYVLRERHDHTEPVSHPSTMAVLSCVSSGIGKRCEIAIKTGLPVRTVGHILLKLHRKRSIIWDEDRLLWKPGVSEHNRMLSMIGLPTNYPKMEGRVIRKLGL